MTTSTAQPLLPSALPFITLLSAIEDHLMEMSIGTLLTQVLVQRQGPGKSNLYIKTQIYKLCGL